MSQIFFISIICGLFLFGCEAPQKYRDVQIGMTSEDVLRLLGNPDNKERINKKAPTRDYFGPKLSAEFHALSEGTLVEVWYYQYFKEEFSYMFNLEQHPPRVVHTDYYHPNIVY